LVDLSRLPLSQVRSKLGIIAQDPILLSGSLRLNLDVEGNYTDDQLYDALHQVQLIKRSKARNDYDDLAGRVSETSSTTAVEDGRQSNIFEDLDSEIKSGGEK
jgi:ABC-type multidrug transport system fused ATPase/permease subunit